MTQPIYLTSEELRAATLVRMQSPSEWPRWPYLPVVRSWKDYPKSNAGVLIEAGSLRNNKIEPIVYIWNMFSGRPISQSPSDRIEYESFEALLDDKWRID